MVRLLQWVAYGLTRCNGFIIKVSDKSIMVLLQLVSLVLKRFTLIIHQERRTSEDRVRTVYRGAALSVLVVIRKVWQTWREQGHKGHCQPSNPVGKGGTSTMHAMLRLLRSFSLWWCTLACALVLFARLGGDRGLWEP